MNGNSWPVKGPGQWILCLFGTLNVENMIRDIISLNAFHMWGINVIWPDVLVVAVYDFDT